MTSNLKLLILERIRITLNLLRKSSYILNEKSKNNGNTIPTVLKDLQELLRNEQNEINIKTVLLPFLSIINSKTISGPYIRIAVESIQVLIAHDAFDQCLENKSDLLCDIVYAILRCKFVQTDFAGDQIVSFQLLDTIKSLIDSKYSSFLPNAVFWKIFEYDILILNDKGSFIMHQLAEQIITSIVKCFITQSSNNNYEIIETKTDRISSLCDIVKYFISGINDRVNLYATVAINNNNNNNQAVTNSLKSHKNQVRHNNETSNDLDTLYLIFVLKLFSSLFIDKTICKLIQDLMIRSDRFYRLITDELGLSLLLLCNARNSSTYPATILQSALSLFSTLLNSIGPCIRILVEFFIRQVYYKALIQTHKQMQNTAYVIGVVSPFISTDSNKIQDINEYYLVEEVELIFESLCDLLSDFSLLPTLFVSFDCCSTSVDIVQPLIENICKCSSLVLSFSSEFMVQKSSFKDRSILIMQLFKQVMKTCEYREKIKLSQQNKSADTLEVFHSEKAMILKKLLKISRTTKSLLLEASKLFRIKAEKGLKYLQKYGALPTPLTAESVARFLRFAPELSKETTGAFLGELGKDTTDYEANSKEFHVELLLKYVSLFEFSNQCVLDCMRIFLSAFRLPGEAQQIDRILVAFSEHCHSNCKEGKMGIIQNAEITYILTFSIIMLNTDRHNPNIKADRKMTKEQFVRNNKNYGKDVKQTVDLSQEYLEQIFDSIDEYPIRTDGYELAAPFNSEVWKDLQMQTHVDVTKSILTTVQHSSTFLDNLIKYKCSDDKSSSLIEKFLSLISNPSDVNIDDTITSDEKATAYITKMLFTSSSGFINPLELTLELNGLHWILQEDIMNCIWLDLFRVCICIHLQKYIDMQQSITLELELGRKLSSKGSALLKDRQHRKLLSISNEFLMILINISHTNKLDFVIQLSVLMLVICSGMTVPTLQNKLTKLLSWEKSTNAFSFLDDDQQTTRSEVFLIDTDLLLYQFCHFEGARASAITLLSIAHQYQSNLSNWQAVLYFLGGLRDCALIPKEIVVKLDDDDILPPNIRLEFEHQLLELDKTLYEETRPKIPQKIKRGSSSLLSLQGIGEVLFGADNATESNSAVEDLKLSDHSTTNEYLNNDTIEFQTIFKFNAISSRWDDGYEIDTQQDKLSSNASDNKSSPSSTNIKAVESDSIPAYTILDGGLTLKDLRNLIATTGISHIISDSRFLSEHSLQGFIDSLIIASETINDNDHNVSQWKENEVKVNQKIYQNCFDFIEVSNTSCKDLLSICHNIFSNKYLFSSATITWLEIVLVEVSLRNRDRFNSIWPLLKRHYLKVLTGSYAKVSYITERRIVGLLKICTRMVSRDNYSTEIIEFMGSIFARSIHKEISISDTLSVSLNYNTSVINLQNDLIISNSFLQQFSNQIAAAMWKVLTINVDLLPQLPLEQWQIMFSILAFCGTSSSFSAIKCFECMAWLLHEPRLIAKVPVFCIIGVKPLLRNIQAPLSVSIGAVHLLMHLHSRLEVLIKDENDDYIDCEMDDNSIDGDTPVLWESCWTPILKALADGIKDTRVEVREACAEALCQTILDKHAQAAPAGVLMLILGGIISPMVIQLRDHVINAINNALPEEFPDRFLTSDEIYTAAHQQWVDVKLPTEQSEISLSNSDGINGTDALSSLLNFDNGTVSILMECLSALCKSLLSHLKKLSSYPSFDKLWLCVLNVLGHFISSNYSNGNNEFSNILKIWDNISIEVKNHAKDLFAMIASSKENLKRMLQALRKEGIFDSKPGLLIVTMETIRQFHGYEDIIASIST